MKDEGEVLKNACDYAVQSTQFTPEYKKGELVRTHCNGAAIYIARKLGCEEFKEETLADDLHAHMLANVSGKWKKSDGQSATIHALGGKLAFAALPGSRLQEPHGHIAAVYPVGTQRSETLKRDVPILANVGKKNGVLKTSEVFPVKRGEPDYFLYVA